MTDRIPLDDMTRDQLDAVYERLEAAEETETQRQLSVAREAFASATVRAARAEAAIARVRALAERWRYTGDRKGTALPELLRALDQPTPTAATQATEHAYLSTGCLHGQHDYCKSNTGLGGAKKPAVCKWCEAHCQCPCHREQSGA